MEPPAPRHPLPGHQRPQAPWLLQPFVLTENFYPAGLPNPRPEHPFQAPPAVVAPGTPRAPPPGFQMAPCGCFFDPRVFHIEWTTTNLPSPATFTLVGSASLPGTAPQGPQSCTPPPAWVPPLLFMPYDPQGRVAAPAPPSLPPSLPRFQHLEGKLQQMKFSSTADPTGVPMGGGILLGSDVPKDSSIPLNGGNAALGKSVIPDTQAMGDAPESPSTSLPEEVLLEEAMRLFDCSLGAGEGSQDSPSSVPIPEEPSDTNSSNPCYDISSLWLPEEMLSSDYSIPEASNAILSMEHLEEIRLNPEELQYDLPLLLSPQDNTFHPKTRLEKRGKKRQNRSLPKKGSKRKASAASAGVEGQH
ncbi:LOW QUALITY PROTEIN: proline-rich protein 22 [Oxyura jamaicensis]|uniref:LOW QUALITY PROTEIN: proline-rich protein 22 n=1 Tax=Oxyura jamaicensis TaxID=8884 RepID=UPI0015A617EC|nr:LOW QUALITY PROTEIN: proline-rich protein 22 [Oxyura jamaicensis]